MANGIIVADSGQGFLVSPSDYDDFELKLEFFPGENTNSGVYFRCEDEFVINADTCYEANIFDHRPSGTGRTGSIVRVEEPAVTIESEGHWNEYWLKANGSHLVVYVNGIETVNTANSRNRRGYISLQYAGGEIRFRNIRLLAH